MSRFLNTLTLDELIDAYQQTNYWMKRIIEAPSCNVAFAFGKTTEEALATIVYDRGQIWQRLVDKIPASHIQQIEELKHSLRMASTDSPKVPIQSGQRWQHRHIRGLIIEINGRDEHNYNWNVTQFITTTFAFTCAISSMSIIKYFIRLNP